MTKPKKSDLYTKTGDRGTTALTGGQRVKKSCLRLECYGTVDELNSFLGLLGASSLPPFQEKLIRTIQSDLFVIGAYLATAAEDSEFKARFSVQESQIKRLEEAIDILDAEVGAMSGFILPAGGTASARAHVARTVCRRLERLLFAFDEEEKVDRTVLTYINRLSDLLFAMARSASHRDGYGDILWKKED